MYEVPISLPKGGGVIKSVEEEYQVMMRGREYQGCGEEYNVGKVEAISSSLKILRLFGRNSSWEEWRGMKCWERKSRYKKGNGEEYQVVGNLYTPVHTCRK